MFTFVFKGSFNACHAMKKVIYAILLFLSVLLLAVGGFLTWITMKDYKPAKTEVLKVDQKQMGKIIIQPRIHIGSWNIGYGGLGKDMDFFYDGGKQTRASLDKTNEYFSGILNILAKNISIDIWLLQEVDRKAKRTYFIDEPARIQDVLSRHNACFAVNYKVPFVPVPVTNPMGEVEAGLLTMSVYSPNSCSRFAYPEIASWPENLFLLDRCFSEMRIPVRNGKELIVINTHNSAFVSDQKLMEKELSVIRNKMMSEYMAGNYVVAAGDWNMNPPHFAPSADYGGHHFAPVDVKFNQSFLPPVWQIVSDNAVPSNRNLDQAYEKGKTGTTTIDYFVLSPNIQLNKVITSDLGFEYSDHNPVYIDIELKDF